MPNLPRLEAGSRSDTGRKRRETGAKVFADPPSHPSIVATRGLLFAVADGLGDPLAGALAADRAITKVKEDYYYGDSSVGVTDALRRAVIAANAAVHDLRQSDSSRAGLGTTFVAAVVHTNRAVVVSVGDSRAYLASADKIRRINSTTVIPSVLERSETGRSAARSDPPSNVVSRLLGTEASVVPEEYDIALDPDDTIVLCTNGLVGQIDEERIRSIATRLNPQRAADELAHLADDWSGPANVGVVVIGPRRSGVAGTIRQIRRILPEIAAFVAIVAVVGAFAAYRIESANPPARASAAVGTSIVQAVATATDARIAASDSLTLGHVPTISLDVLTPLAADSATATLDLGATPTAAGIDSTLGVPATVGVDQVSPTPPPTAALTATTVPTATPPPTTTATVVPTPDATAPRRRSAGAAFATPRGTATPFAATPTPLPALVLNPAVSSNGTVSLSWSYNGTLTADESFDIRVWGSGGGDPSVGIANASAGDRSYLIGSGFIYGPGTYYWTVAIIRKSGYGVDTVSEAAGPPLLFTWAPSSSSTGRTLRPP